jgi:hypothetical protein
MKKNLIFYFPVTYLFYSRLNSILEKASWIFVFPGIVFLMNYLWFGSNYSTIQFVVLFILYLCSWYSIYEIGYIENDAITIKEEENPTLRISKNEIHYVRKSFVKVSIFRLSLLVVILYVISLFVSLFQILLFTACLIITFMLFKAHNYFRTRINILTYFGLSFFKYYSFSLLFLEDDYLQFALFWILLFPLLRTVEHATKVKYRLPALHNFIGDHDVFRVVYYSAIVIVGMPSLYFFDLGYSFVVFSIGALLFLLFRAASLSFVRFTNFNRIKREAHNWKN